MKFISKKIILSNPTRLFRFKEEILKTNKSQQKNELSLSTINQNNNELDKDKINLENINYFEKNIFNKKSLQTQNNSFIKFHNVTDKNINHPLSISKNLFANKLIRNFNKINDIQINIFDQEISMKNLLTTKRNKFFDNKYQVINADKNDTIHNKNKILHIIRTQTKSNFNNKYKLMFKSSNIKKRNLIQNYFSLLKQDIIKFDYEPINSTSRKLYFSKNDKLPDISYRLKQKKKINKDILNNINYSHISKRKRKLVFIPISNLKTKEDKKDSKIKIKNKIISIDK